MAGNKVVERENMHNGARLTAFIIVKSDDGVIVQADTFAIALVALFK
jgi:hypothetical protein